MNRALIELVRQRLKETPRPIDHIAVAANLRPETVMRFRLGITERPHRWTVKAIAAALGLNINWSVGQ